MKAMQLMKATVEGEGQRSTSTNLQLTELLKTELLLRHDLVYCICQVSLSALWLFAMEQELASWPCRKKIRVRECDQCD